MTNKIDNDGTDLDDDLTAEDVEAAIAQRAKEQLRSGKVQAAYYNSYTYLRDLRAFAFDTRDEQLKSAIASALDALDLYHETLEQEYKWD